MEKNQKSKSIVLSFPYTFAQNRIISISFWVKCVLLFFFIFDIYFSSAFGLPTWITSRRLILCFMLVAAFFSGPQPQIFRYNSVAASIKLMTLFQLLLLFYSAMLLIIIGFGSGERLAIHIVKFLMIAILGAVAFSAVFNSLDELMRALVVVMTVQAVIIFLFLVCSSLQAMADNFIGVAEQYARLHEEKYYTGLACAAAPGVLRMSPGLAACIYFVTKKDGSLIFTIPFCLISVAAIIIARTGLFVVGVALLVMVIGVWKCNRKKFIPMLGIYFCLFLLGLCLIVLLGLNDEVMELFPRLMRLFHQGFEDAFFKSYLNHPNSILPKLSVDTMVGIGIISGAGGNGIRINIDGGYLRMYAAVGAPIAIIFYFAMLFLLGKPVSTLHKEGFRYAMIFMFLYIFLGEFKEYFIYDNYGICLYYAMLLLYEKSAFFPA